MEFARDAFTGDFEFMVARLEPGTVDAGLVAHVADADVVLERKSLPKFMTQSSYSG